MGNTAKKVESYSAECVECGAEVVIMVVYAPAFRDFEPTCPYCHKEIPL